jgi:hypothetical protein
LCRNKFSDDNGYGGPFFFNNYVDDSVLGRFYVDYCAEPSSLYSDHIQREKSLPLHVVDGKIAEGYIPLTPVTPYSHYRVRAEIGRND